MAYLENVSHYWVDTSTATILEQVILVWVGSTLPVSVGVGEREVRGKLKVLCFRELVLTVPLITGFGMWI